MLSSVCLWMRSTRALFSLPRGRFSVCEKKASGSVQRRPCIRSLVNAFVDQESRPITNLNLGHTQRFCDLRLGFAVGRARQQDPDRLQWFLFRTCRAPVAPPQLPPDQPR